MIRCFTDEMLGLIMTKSMLSVLALTHRMLLFLNKSRIYKLGQRMKSYDHRVLSKKT